MRTILLTTLVILSSAAADQGGASGTSAGSNEQPAWMELTRPTAQNQQLQQLAGTWNVTVRSFMPGQDASESKGQSTITPILDGRFIREDFTGQFMGQPFTGLGLMGFDRIRQQYTTSWYDSMSTGALTAKGVSDDDGRTITFRGEYSCPMTGAIVPTRIVRTVSADGQSMSCDMFDTRNGQESKSMELRYTRAK